MRPPSTLHLWTPFRDDSSDDEEDQSPRAAKAKESPLPSISSSWEASPPALRGLHHRITTTATTTRTEAFRQFSSPNKAATTDHHVLPRTVHSPYRVPTTWRRTQAPRSKTTETRKYIVIGFGTLVLACWIVTGILYAHLPSWWSNDDEDPTNGMPLSIHYVERSPIRHNRGTNTPQSSTTRRYRDSRRHWVRPQHSTVDLQPPRLEWSRDEDEPVPNRRNPPTASLEALCGYAAEMALLQHPEYFPADRALDDKSRLLWIGGQWDVLANVLAACPRTRLLALVRELPEDPLERIHLLQQHPSLIFDSDASSSSDNPVRFIELLPLGLQTRQTNQSVNVTDATHVVWALEPNDDERSLLTQFLQIRQMLHDLQGITHLVVLAPAAPAWQQVLVRGRIALSQSSVTWVSNLASLVPVLQMKHPTTAFWVVDDTVRDELLPTAATAIEAADPNASMPCASECGPEPPHCQASAWDETIALTHSLTQECTVVVYTAAGGVTVRDLAATEYKDDENLSEYICNVALVSQQSPLVQSSIQRVPNSDLVRLGVEPKPGDDVNAIHERKLKVLNGKLLYKGWILVWTDMTWTDNSMLAVSPGRFWSDDVKYALYCDATTAPTWQDVQFLLHQMNRPGWPARNAKQGQLHYQLPAEPPRQAVLLLTERQFRDKKKKTRTLRKALSKWGKDEISKNVLQRQAKLYDQYDIWINRQRYQRRYYKPQSPIPYRYQLARWASTQWILHDLKSGEGSNLRCQWYKEVFHTHGSPALALAHLLALQEMERRIEFGEPDDHAIQHTWARRMTFKAAVTDTQEWIPLAVEANKPFASSAYQLDTTLTLSQSTYVVNQSPEQPPLYVRIMSDRVIAAARRAFRG